MKLDCPRKEFFEAVSLAGTAASVRTSLPILQNLKIEAEGQSIRVLGCDNEMWVERKVPCIVHEPGAVCVPARRLIDVVRELPDGDIQLEVNDGSGLLMQQGASEYRMKTLEPGDFPEPPEFGGEAELTLPMGVLRDAVDSVLFAVSTDAHRPILTGVLLTYDGEVLSLVATDTHRLAVRRVPQPGIGSNISTVVPDKALRAIKGLPLGDDDPVTLCFGAGRLGVNAGTARVVSQLLAGVYPNWERVVPTESTRSWSVERDQLHEKLARAMILAKGNANRVRFKGDGDQILISAKSEETGDAKEEVPMVPQDGDVEIAFNGRYVLDALATMPGPGLRIEMTESSRPAVFRPADDGDHYFCVIMPMALA